MTDDTVLKVALAGLLRDIGKLAQRANPERTFPEIIANYDQFCTDKKDGGHGYLQYAHTAFFIERYVPEGLFDKRELFEIACHHKNQWEDICKEADILAGGMERTDTEDESGITRKDSMLHSIFDLVELQYAVRDQKGHYNNRWLLPPAPVGEHPWLEIFPCFKGDSPSETEESTYENLWQQFVVEVEGIGHAGSPTTYFNDIYWLLEKYTCRIPSASYEYNDISLFDHAKTFAALASLLHLSNYSQQGKFLLYGGDISGIKSYIFRISQAQGFGGISKRLRGRSFTVSMLSEVFSRYLLRCFGLTVANVNFCGGGNLEILLPDSQEVRNLLANFEEEANDWLIEGFQGELGFVSAWVELSNVDLRNDRYAQRRDELADALSAAKQHKYHTHFAEKGFWVEKKAATERVTACPSCAIRLMGHDEVVCKSCEDDAKVGAFLPKALYLYFSDVIDEKTSRRDERAINFGKFGTVVLCSEPPTLDAGTQTAVYRISPAAKGSKAFYRLGTTLPVALETMQLETEADEYEGGRVQAGQVLSFTTLAQMATGDTRIGVLKMDVDNLGQIFSIGLGVGSQQNEELSNDRLRSISRLATLSREMTVFFSSLVERAGEAVFKRWQEAEDNNWQWKDKVASIFYLVFSGGDDLAVVGPWNRIIELAWEIRQRFKDYTCHNPNLSLSAGLYICKPKEPIGYIMDKAEEALGESKKKGRNRVTVMGETMVWAREDEKSMVFQKELAQSYPGQLFEEEEVSREMVFHCGLSQATSVAALTFAELRTFEEELATALAASGVSRRLPQHLISASNIFFKRVYNDDKERFEEESNLMVIPHLLYTLERNASEEARQKLKMRLITTGVPPAYVRQAYYPCKSVLMKTRKP